MVLASSKIKSTRNDNIPLGDAENVSCNAPKISSSIKMKHRLRRYEAEACGFIFHAPKVHFIEKSTCEGVPSIKQSFIFLRDPSRRRPVVILERSEGSRGGLLEDDTQGDSSYREKGLHVGAHSKGQFCKNTVYLN